MIKKDPYFALKLPLKVLVTEQFSQVEVAIEFTESLISGTNITIFDVENNLYQAHCIID